MSKKNPVPRKRNRSKNPRDRIEPLPPAPVPTLEQVQAENAKLRERNERLEEINVKLSRRIQQADDVVRETVDLSKFAETIGTENREDELIRLRGYTKHLEDELNRRRTEDPDNAAHRQAFELIKHLATLSHRFESIEVRAAPEKLVNRAVPYEATLVITYPAGTHRLTAIAGDPARALLEALAQFTDQMRVRKIQFVEDLGPLFVLIDNQQVINKMTCASTHEFALAK